MMNEYQELTDEQWMGTIEAP